MASDEDDRLSRITTHWSLVFRAHQDRGPDGKAAQAELLHRYRGAICRYVRSVVRDENAVEELCQQFAYRFVRGDFHRAHPDRGRFRNFVKTAVAHLITDWRREQHARQQLLDSALRETVASPGSEPRQQFDDLWRAELIDQAWKQLAEFEEGRHDRWLYTALRYRVEHPEQSSAEMAAELGQRRNAPLTAENVDKTLERARQKFAVLLLDEVARSLGAPTPEELREEVIELGLLPYCEQALVRRGD
jgi:RNA polymerase sigma-70 factor (ECF subfamily)